MNYLEKFKDINTFILDVDGVLTNSELLILENGALLRTMNVRDGYAIKRAVEKGYRVCIITGGQSKGVKLRLEGLGVTDIYDGVSDKMDIYTKYIKAHGLNPDTILYMGDDIPDYEVMRHVGLPVCPMDAAHEISEFAQYISPRKGGEGCVRDVIEKVLRLHDYWLDYDRQHHATETELE